MNINTKGNNMSKHAKGPWKVEPYVDAIHVHDAEGVIVADISDRKIGTGEPPANARLIAAAPELLEGCRKALEFWNSDYPNDTTEGHEARRFIQSAIAKAEGKQ